MLKTDSGVRRRLAGLVSLCLLISITAAPVQAADSAAGKSGASYSSAAGGYSGSSSAAAAGSDASDASGEAADTASAAEDSTETIHISTAQELQELSDSCSSDSWSQNKIVILDRDISLEGTGFSSIPSFGGTFQGGGHTISGLTIRGGCSPAGLFTELQSSAVVRNLNVTGTVSPTGSGMYIGGIAGTNAGTIVNCSFSGTVEGSSCTGGIAGRNEEGGLITLCSSSGSITGMSMTGGIAGENAGTILGCESDAQVNHTSVDPSINLQDVDLSLKLDLSGLKNSTTAVVPTDTGGIAGYSSGSILGCVSSGVAGYEHVGYNVGGIAGRTCGYIAACRSKGTVNGRKDVGGIAGQAEPAIAEVLTESQLSILQGQLTEVQSTVTQLQQDAQGAESTITEQASSLSDSLAAVSNSLQNINTSVSVHVPDVSSALSGYIGSIGSNLPDIGDGLPDIGGDLSGAVDSLPDIGSSLPDIDSGLSDIGSDISGAAGSLPDIDSGLSDIGSDISGAVDSLPDIDSGLSDIGSDISGAAGGLSDIASAVGSDITSGLSSVVSSFTSGISASATTDLSGVRSALNIMSAQVASMTDAFEGTSTTISTDMNALTGQVTDVMGTVDEMLNSGDADRIVQDVSLLTPELVACGKIAECENSGTVEGDLNVGGIAGILALEYGLDPEDDTTFELSAAVNAEYDLTAVLRSCTNSGVINSKHDYAGGIVGRTSLGLVLNCESYGPIESTDGDYVGGIAGFNTSTIQGCWAKTILAGGSYIGGITGSSAEEGDDQTAGTVKNCVSMVAVSRGAEYLGAISGDERGAYTGNVFVSDTLSGLNRISRAGIAEAISYEDLQENYDEPREFRSLTVRFLAEDAVIDSLTMKYGDALTEDMLPELPVREGYYGRWEKTSIDSLTMDTVIAAVYEPNVTAISSSTLRDDGRPVFYLQGSFDDTAVLTEKRQEPAVSIDELGLQRSSLSERGRELLEQWTVTLPEDGADTHTLRYRTPNGKTEHIAVFLLEDGSWTQVETAVQGSYLTFPVSGSSCTLAVVSSETMVWLWVLIGCTAAVLALILIVLISGIRHRRRRSRTVDGDAPAAETAGDPEKTAETEETEKKREEKLRSIALELARQESAEAVRRKEAEYRELTALADGNEIYTVLLQRNRESDLAVIQRELELRELRIQSGELSPEERAAAEQLLQETDSAESGAEAEEMPAATEKQEKQEKTAGRAKKAKKEKTQKTAKTEKTAGKRGRRVRRVLLSLLLIPLILLIAGVTVVSLRPQLVWRAMSSAMLTRLVNQEPLTMMLDAEAIMGGKELPLHAELCRTKENGAAITCVDTDGLTLYYSGGTVYLENGSGYTIDSSYPDYSELADRALEVYRGTDVTAAREGGYTILTAQVQGEAAEAMLALLVPGAADSLEKTDTLKLSMYTMGTDISSLAFSGGGTLKGGIDLDVNATLQVAADSAAPSIPEAVLTAVAAGDQGTPLTLNADTLRLLSAWGSFSAEDPQAAAITLRTSCSLLSLSTDLDWYRTNVSGTAVSCVSIGGTSIYSSERGICGAGGITITADQQNTASAAELIDLALQLCQSGETTVAEANGNQVYTLALAGDTLSDAACRLIPQLTDLNPSLTSGTLTVTVSGGILDCLTLTLSGEAGGSLLTVPVTITADAHFDHNRTPEDCTIPSSVISALVS